ncbi:hypothetical protein BOO69_12335 [Sulfitobacter alexandrii]|uniref:Uncharacterized protein n=1 Tax=Sulfitobacter alexandrii TaxID=1917485 RepID=A0A1J0WIG5_9RHOB|nr:hypothetical protein [Sulfitobacter alexandrii]APE44106.1 hypothetical protein BOO69_12335 [Sulfitobacter alexandrii]
MNLDDENEVLATVQASAGRRILGIGCLLVLGVLLIYLAFATPPSLPWQAFLILVGAGALWCADAMRRATASRVELTPLVLRDADGTVIAQVDGISGIDRGFFAFKPSNGFLLKLDTPGGRAWRPGLWWRVGRRIGIGGMTPGSQTKFMSEVLSALLAQRNPPD